MTTRHATRPWPTLPIVAVGVVLSLLAAAQLDRLTLNGDLYGLLGGNDPAVMTFHELAEVTTGLEELLVVCEPDQYLPRIALEKITSLPSVTANTRTYIQPGKSSLYTFSLSGDPADYLQSGVVIDRVRAVLAAMAPTCGMAGTPAYVVEAHDRLNTDLLAALAVAVLLVTMLFAFVYRIGWLALVMLLPVGLGIMWGLATYSLVRAELTLFAAAVPTLLVGIGIDHCIHMIQACRYSIVHDGLSRDAAVISAWWRLLRPVTIASLTTIATFCALSLAQLRGFADFGLCGALVSAGVWLACTALLPVILLSCPERWLAGKAAFESPLRRFAPWLQKRAMLVALSATAITAIAVFAARDLELLSDIRQLEGTDLEARILQNRIADEYGLSASPILVRFVDHLDAVEFMADIDRPRSIASLVEVPGVAGLVQVHAVENPFIRENYQAVTWDIQQQIKRLGLGRWQLSGAPAMNARIDELLFADIRYILPLAAAFILLVLVIGTRSGSLPFIVLLPLVLSLIWVTGAMSLGGVAASVVTAAIVPIVLGIGVDGGVHLLASWQRHDGDLASVFAETGLAIVVTVTTSIAAFGAFMIANSPSLAQFGAQAAGALLGCLLVTVLLLPVLLQHRRTATFAAEK
ncbi:MAG: efflux RND transporter permease subunit [Gammaproteobacteria bacterium]|nr:efflux RND transporter permease subunit [Gammaproteobacteria bacterium]MDH5323202.1 efflux RND transporter permease subunit [Gammaproteobacteria bacterium]